jgi:branched-chain amino acid transport system permease protein
MAAAVGSIIFVVVVVGGLGSLAGAFITSLLIGMMQTFAVALDVSLASLGLQVPSGSALAPLARLTLAQVAPVLPYLLLVVMLIVRPKGLMGRRES